MLSSSWSTPPSTSATNWAFHLSNAPLMTNTSARSFLASDCHYASWFAFFNNILCDSSHKPHSSRSLVLAKRCILCCLLCPCKFVNGFFLEIIRSFSAGCKQWRFLVNASWFWFLNHFLYTKAPFIEAFVTRRRPTESLLSPDSGPSLSNASEPWNTQRTCNWQLFSIMLDFPFSLLHSKLSCIPSNFFLHKNRSFFFEVGLPTTFLPVKHLYFILGYFVGIFQHFVNFPLRNDT